MPEKHTLEKQVAMAAREQGMNSVLLRNAVSRKLGLNIADMECLNLLTMKGISSPTELARYTGLTPGSATAMLDRLEKAGLIERKANPHDRRGVLIGISEQSIQRIASMFTEAQRAQRELIAGYSAEELAVIADFLGRFAHNTKDHAKLIEETARSSTSARQTVTE